jgi:hypothetical protein
METKAGERNQGTETRSGSKATARCELLWSALANTCSGCLATGQELGPSSTPGPFTERPLSNQMKPPPAGDLLQFLPCPKPLSFD